MHYSRRGLFATAIVVALILGGLSLIGVWLAAQRQAPHPTGESETPPRGIGDRATLRESKVIGPVLSRSKPVTLDIPSIEVHSAVQYLGQSENGALEAPAPGPNYNKAAWYRHSPTPGSLGPAIISGHVDSLTDGPSVFFRLGELRRGDRVRITRADDSIAVFTVDEVHRYAKAKFPTKLVYGNINHAGLRMVTCGGAFDDSTGHYLDNVVVFASLSGSQKT